MTTNSLRLETPADILRLAKQKPTRDVLELADDYDGWYGCGFRLYAAIPAEDLQRILASGFPGGDTIPAINLSFLYSPFCAAHLPIGADGRVAIVEIDLHQLDHDAMYPLEELRGARYRPGAEGDGVGSSLILLGGIAYKATIPATAITRYVVIDQADKCTVLQIAAGIKPTVHNTERFGRVLFGLTQHLFNGRCPFPNWGRSTDRFVRIARTWMALEWHHRVTVREFNPLADMGYRREEDVI